ncbi:MAG: cysteine desulfurase family protein [Planctomycetota bacterium]|nr:cysteine desulfurase family protein [Planctomycetota bacterium]
MRRLYLDHNASSPLRESAREILQSWSLGNPGANPSSAHEEGRLARRALETARERLASLIGCQPEELVFTSGGTESNTWALSGWDSVAMLPVEHPSVLAPGKRSAHTTLLPLNAAHQVDLELADPLLQSCQIASVGLANHETGSLQPVKALARQHSQRSWLLHTDASQALGRIPVSFQELGADLMTLSSHKCGGPPGIGALVLRQGTEHPALILGGPQESSRRAGTESVLLAQLFCAAAEEALARHQEEKRTWNRFSNLLRKEIPKLDPASIFISKTSDCLPNTLCVAFPGRPGPALVHRLDLEGVSVSHGSACASGSLEPSPVLEALGCPETVSHSSLRVSFGHGHADRDAELFLERLKLTLDAVQVRTTTQKNSAGHEQ